MEILLETESLRDMEVGQKLQVNYSKEHLCVKDQVTFQFV